MVCGLNVEKMIQEKLISSHVVYHFVFSSSRTHRDDGGAEAAGHRTKYHHELDRAASEQATQSFVDENVQFAHVLGLQNKQI